MARADSTAKGTWLVECSESNQLPVCVARTLVSILSEMVPVRVVNTSLTPTTVYKNSRIATAEHISEHTICTARESEAASIGDIHIDNLSLVHPCLMTLLRLRERSSKSCVPTTVL